MVAISAMGWMVPSSLFACMTVMRTVLDWRPARISCGSTTPERPGGTKVTSAPVGAVVSVTRGFDRAQNGEVVGFGAATGEHDFGRLGADESGNGFAGMLDGVAGALAGGMNGAGVAVGIAEIRQHSVEDFGRDGSGRVVIEVDAHVRRAISRR